MKVAILYGKEELRIEEREIPSPGKGEVLLRVKTALTCGTDLKVFLRGGHPRMIKPPSPFGHEFSGVVEEVGDGVERWKKGMRVVSVNSAPCFSCFHCRKGEYSLCEDLLFINGAYAEYMLIPERIQKINLYPIPEGVSFQEAAFLEPLSCVVHGMEEIGVETGEKVVILGAGPIGLLFLLLAQAKGARVMVVDKAEKRLEKVEELGGIPVNLEDKEKIFSLTPEGRGADVVIEAVGLPEAWETSLKLVRKGGRILLFGGCPAGSQAEMDTGIIHYGEITLKGVFHHTPRLVNLTYELIRERILPLEKLITHTLPLEELPRALELVRNKEALKIAILP